MGSIIALAGIVIPPFFSMSVVFFFYDAFSENAYVSAALHGMGAAVVALLVDVIYSMTKGIVQQKDLFNVFIMIAAFVAAFFFNISIVLIIVSACVIGLIRTEISRYFRGR
jgi:chromate transporter